MIFRKKKNFDDFSHYYHEENRELLKKESIFSPLKTIFITTLLISILSYSIYHYYIDKREEIREDRLN